MNVLVATLAGICVPVICSPVVVVLGVDPKVMAAMCIVLMPLVSACVADALKDKV